MTHRLHPGRHPVIAAATIIFAVALAVKAPPTNAEPQGILNQHIEISNRNSRAFEAKDEKALAADLTADYERTDLFGRKQNRQQELDAERQLFNSAKYVSEFSQPVRLTVQGGDATHPTVATTLVETTRSAAIAGSDGRSHATTWQTVTTETRLREGDTWKCSRREELKRKVVMDGAPYIPDLTAQDRTVLREIQSAYDQLARSLDKRSYRDAGTLLAPGFEARPIDMTPVGSAAFLANIEQDRKTAWKTQYSFEITGLQSKDNLVTVIAEHVLLRQAPDAQGVYKTVRHRVTSRDVWARKAGTFLLSSSNALLEEQDVVLPIQAAGWK